MYRHQLFVVFSSSTIHTPGKDFFFLFNLRRRNESAVKAVYKTELMGFRGLKEL